MNSIKVGLLGIGTVGLGTFNVLQRNQKEIARRTGCNIEIVMIADLNKANAIMLTHGNIQIVEDAFLVVSNPKIQVIIELIGGCQVAKNLVLTAISNNKHVITANKALIAEHGNEIFKAAQEKNVIVAFEAAVGGGIPIIKILRESLTANCIQFIAGIINGTTNFILSEMHNKNLNFDIALKEAQSLGYAEINPTFDIQGIDAAHKLTIMASLAFGIPLQFNKTYIEGITQLHQEDIEYTKQLGYRIKLLGITKLTSHGIELRVHPTLIQDTHLIAHVEGAMNAIIVTGDAIEETAYYGKGAGSEPTASSVIADLVDITRLITVNTKNRVPYLAFQPSAIINTPILEISNIITNYYLRIQVNNSSNALANIIHLLINANISIETLLQKKRAINAKNITDIIVITHKTNEQNIDIAILKLEKLTTIINPIIKIRIENFK